MGKFSQLGELLRPTPHENVPLLETGHRNDAATVAILDIPTTRENRQYDLQASASAPAEYNGLAFRGSATVRELCSPSSRK